MKKLLAVMVTGLFAAGAFAAAPADVVVVPAQSVQSVAYVVKHHPRYVKHHRRIVHHPRHRAPIRHRM